MTIKNCILYFGFIKLEIHFYQLKFYLLKINKKILIGIIIRKVLIRFLENSLFSDNFKMINYSE